MKAFKIFIFFACLNCVGQTPILDIAENNGEQLQNSYYKDIHHVLDQFEGSYIYTSGGTTLEVFLHKLEMDFNGWYYADIIVGEYDYINNDEVVIDTTADLPNGFQTESLHSISGNMPLTFGNYLCQDCTAGEVRIYAGLAEKSTGCFAQIILGKANIGNQEALTMKVVWQAVSWKEGSPKPKNSFPGGNYILLKQ